LGHRSKDLVLPFTLGVPETKALTSQQVSIVRNASYRSESCLCLNVDGLCCFTAASNHPDEFRLPFSLPFHNRLRPLSSAGNRRSVHLTIPRAPTRGPLIGGFAAQSKGWTWTIWGLMWLSGFTLILLIFFLHETSVANILYRRARRLRELTGQTDLSSEAQIETEELKIKGSFFAIPLRSSVPTKRCPGSCIRDLM
jgi:hypothetical protein